MDARTALEFQWPYLLKFCPSKADLDTSASKFGAIRRRRSVRSGSDLLRFALAYAVCGMSLRQLAAWAEGHDLAAMSNVAMLKRLRGSASWLGNVLATMLAERADSKVSSAHRLRLIDATCVSEPASKGTDWRIHLSWDLGAMRIDAVEVTDSSGGESLTRFAVQPGEIAIADRGYGKRRGLFSVVSSGGDFVVRLNWQNLPLEERDGRAFNLLGALREMPEAEAASWDLRVAAGPDTPAFDVRLAAIRKSETAADSARERVIKEASKKKRSVDPRTLESASYFFVVTSLKADEADAAEILELYRLRWQVELAFKRMKGLLQLGELPVKDPDLVRTYLFAKLIGALILDDFTEAHLGFSPWGYPIRRSPYLPLANPA